MKIRVAAQATTIVLFALVMGVFWGTWFSLSRTMDQLSPETFVAVGHEMIQNLGMPMAVLLPLALLSGLVTLVLLWPHRTAAFWWLAAAPGPAVGQSRSRRGRRPSYRKGVVSETNGGSDDRSQRGSGPAPAVTFG